MALCGHATLASTHALYANGIVPPNIPIEYKTQTRGSLMVHLDREYDNEVIEEYCNRRIVMNFPVYALSVCSIPPVQCSMNGVDVSPIGTSDEDVFALFLSVLHLHASDVIFCGKYYFKYLCAIESYIYINKHIHKYLDMYMGGDIYVHYVHMCKSMGRMCIYE